MYVFVYVCHIYVTTVLFQLTLLCLAIFQGLFLEDGPTDSTPSHLLYVNCSPMHCLQFPVQALTSSCRVLCKSPQGQQLPTFLQFPPVFSSCLSRPSTFLSPWVLSHQHGQAPLMLKMPLLLHFLFPTLPSFSAPINDQSS